GGARSTQATLDGLVHDHCAGFHPLAVDNAFTKFAQLEEYGLQWAWPEVQYAHPLDDGDGAAAYRSVAQTAEALHDPSWQPLLGSLSEQLPNSTRYSIPPMLRLPDAPFQFANSELRAGLPAKVSARLLRNQRPRALFSGVAAHPFRPLQSFGS